MKVVMTLLVRDEADILAANIDFHLAMGVDFVIATDNLSTDRTAEILRHYEKRGVLQYLHESDDDYSQHRWVTRMARMAATEHAADWVINNDADEFWWPETGDLKGVLERVPGNVDAVSAKRTNFLPTQTVGTDFFAETMTLRESVSLNAVGRPLPDKVCHRGTADIDVAQGNHSVSRRGSMLKAVPAAISIMHFPLRSYDQFANKISKGGAAYARNSQLPKGIGATWRHLYDLWQNDELREHFAQAVPNTDDVQRGLSDGRYIRDERLKRFFEQNHELGCV